jgi:hypothetical protein
MNDSDSQHRPFQYSLWSLFVLTTVVAVLCSIGASADWRVPAMIVAGVSLSIIGYRLDAPRLRRSFAGVGCFVRLVGLLLVIIGLLLFAVGLGVRLR